MQLLIGDCLEQMKTLESNSVDSIVTDPPYGLSFMGKKWDYDVPSVEVWKVALRVLKPGGHLLSFGGTRTYHRMVCAIEDAGFEIRDQIMWIYGSGFPKSLDISKAIDKAAGAEREVVGPSARHGGGSSELFPERGSSPITAPSTDLAKQWQGWGTALKPANEPIVLARKPLVGTVAANVEKFGTGGLNIDASRISCAADDPNLRPNKASHNLSRAADLYASDRTWSTSSTKLDRSKGETMHLTGRWPANVLLDEEAAALLDEQSGESSARGGNSKRISAIGFSDETGRKDSEKVVRNDSGCASRFFYVAKASKRERNAGLEGMPTQVLATTTGQTRPNKPARLGADPHAVQEPVQNFHPTVKPIKLMQYLIKLVTPPGGTVLDPFMGSGSTGCACVSSGFDFIGIEMNEEYFEISKRRICHSKEAA